MATLVKTIYVEPENDGQWAIHGHTPGERLGYFVKRDDAITSARTIAKRNQFQMVVKHNVDTVDFVEDYCSVED